ncbi:MAG TPA: glycoside hydrolase family 38 C-terminal domain-containing protein, partial [Flavitalea sp.]|nr:glycoside hydrolase family 38 C-terminal domain-containing protein [Flavitalea sp.]
MDITTNTVDTPSFSYIVHPWYKYRNDGKPGREIMLYFDNGSLKKEATVSIDCDGRKENFVINPTKPLDSLQVLLPENAGLKPTNAEITIVTDEGQSHKKIIVPAGRHWTVYIYPHSHVDIGYTNLQEVVQALHVRNIDVGIDIARKTQNYPSGAKFIWNPEATWVVEHYLKQGTPEQKQHFIEAVRNGWIQVDAGHSNINTSTCSDEEMMRMFRNSNDIESVTGVPINTMVQMDLPGAGWGIVQAAAKNGVHGFISFPNTFDLRKTWEHKPFYWISQDGKDKILFLQGSPYGIGFTVKGRKYGLAKLQSFTAETDRVSTEKPLENFIDPFIFNETAKLERDGSPYDIFAMTWSMADNCLIDADLPEAVRLWNQTYAYPKLIISGAKDILTAYEKRYKNIIPTYKGDYTEFWTNGLGSDARRVGMSRRAKENLVQAETLWALLNPGEPAPVKAFNNAWENVLLGAEHTWGYQDPKAPLAKTVEAKKASYFENAEIESRQLINSAVKTFYDHQATDDHKADDHKATGFAVVNTLSWSRSGVITLSPAQSRQGDKVIDENKKEVLSQRLSTGELCFLAKDVPALGSKLYKVIAGSSAISKKYIADSLRAVNDLLSLALDGNTGDIKQLVQLKTGHDFVDSSSQFKMNAYQYVTGVYNGVDSPRTVSTTKNVSVSVKEDGPVFSSFLIRSAADGCRYLTREVRVYNHMPYVELINTIDKTGTRNKEAIHFSFPFNIPSGKTHLDIPWGIIVPEHDQLPGANRNWLTFQRWIDISNQKHGVTWTAIESPLVEFGNLSGNILDGARQTSLWTKKLLPSQTLISWPLNNHWDTNFPLQQEGVMTFTYGILLHDAYSPVVANRFGVEQNR